MADMYKGGSGECKPKSKLENHILTMHPKIRSFLLGLLEGGGIGEHTQQPK